MALFDAMSHTVQFCNDTPLYLNTNNNQSVLCAVLLSRGEIWAGQTVAPIVARRRHLVTTLFVPLACCNLIDAASHETTTPT